MYNRRRLKQTGLFIPNPQKIDEKLLLYFTKVPSNDLSAIQKRIYGNIY
jgi:hypothetical protein